MYFPNFLQALVDKNEQKVEVAKQVLKTNNLEEILIEENTSKLWAVRFKNSSEILIFLYEFKKFEKKKSMYFSRNSIILHNVIPLQCYRLRV